MNVKLGIILLCVSLPFISYGQVSEDFSDGDFSNAPAWTGMDADFEVLNQELHLNALAVSSSSYLVIQSESINSAVWLFKIRMEFNPSSSNYSKFYLVSDSQDLNSSLNGYFVKVGSTADDISLYSQSGTTETQLIDGTDGILNTSPVDVSVKVTRDPMGNWELFSDINSTGTFVSEGTISDNSTVKSIYSGWLCNYTSTRSTKFYLDDVTITGNPYQDVYPPELISLSIIDASEIQLEFSEELETLSAEEVSNYFIPELGPPAGSLLDQINARLVTLSFSSQLTNGFEYNLHIKNVADLNGNPIDSIGINFLYFVEIPANKNDVIVNEFFPDPAPSIQLPEAEFIELYNASNNPFDLNGWQISDGNTTGSLGTYLLLPDSFLIVCPSSYLNQYSAYGSAISASSWPSQNNSGDHIVLKDADQNIISSISYSNDWYQDTDKKDGGWTLERIDPTFDCGTKSNWRASLSENGGTPGSTNSVFGIEDKEPPDVIDLLAIDPAHIALHLNESLATSTLSNFSLNLQPNISVDSTNYDTSSDVINIYLHENIPSNASYTISASGAADCFGNELSFNSTIFLDYLPPSIVSITNTHFDRLLVELSEPVTSSSISKSNFVISGNNPYKIIKEDELHYTFYFTNTFEDEKNYVLDYMNLKDIQENIGTGNFEFVYHQPYDPQFGDLVITEIMADPEPVLGVLPNSQYVEIFNRNNQPISLVGLSISDARSETTFHDGYLPGNSYAILAPSTQASLFQNLGLFIPVTSWPSFNKTSESVILTNRNDEIVHRVDYDISWYGDEEKEEGGWSLEMIDPDNLCGANSNWRASQSDTGGTPGAINSVSDTNPDLKGPQIVNVFVIDSVDLELEFNEWIHPEIIPQFILQPEIDFESINPISDSLNLFKIRLAEPLSPSIAYSISSSSTDCNENISTSTFDPFYLPETCDSMDIVINEIYFNPPPGGTDFIELYNASQKHIMLKDFTQFGYKSEEKTEETILTSNYRMINPGEYLVLTSELEIFQNLFPFVDNDNILETALPSLPDDEGQFILKNYNGLVIDSVYYSEDWHHPLLETNEGVSLERLSPSVSSTLPSNWKSASSTEGFATPGRVNSHFMNEDEIISSVKISPEIFFPGTGNNDSFCTIYYDFDMSDLIGTINIFNNTGRLIKHLEQNQLLSNHGFFTWDGINDNGTKATMGHYFIVFDIFSPSGFQKRFRKKVVVGSR